MSLFDNVANGQIKIQNPLQSSSVFTEEASKVDANHKTRKMNIPFKFIDIKDASAKKYLKENSYCKEYYKYITTEQIGEIVVDPTTDKIAGYVFIDNKKYPGFITPIIVLPKYRGYGIGTKLLKDAIRKYDAVDLCVDKDNEIAIKMYKDHGFVVIGDGDKKSRYWMKLKSKITKDDVKGESVHMSLFDTVASGKIQMGPEQLLRESMENTTEVYMLEAMYSDSLPYGKVMSRKINLPIGHPPGTGNLAFLYTTKFEDSLALIKNHTNAIPGQKYKWYFYQQDYRGMIWNKRYRFRNMQLRKSHYDTVRKSTTVKPYIARIVSPDEEKNLLYDLHTYVSIINEYSKKMSVPRKVRAYWDYMKPILTKAVPSLKTRMVLVNLDQFHLGDTLQENLNHPLYMIWYTLYKYPECLVGVDVDFLFFSGMKILKINPTQFFALPDEKLDDGAIGAVAKKVSSAIKMPPKNVVTGLQIQMKRIIHSVPDQALDEKKLQEEDIKSVIIDETKTKMGLSDKDKKEIIDETDVTNVADTVKKEEDQIAKSVEQKVSVTADRVLKAKPMERLDISRQEGKVKTVVQMMVDNDINEDQKILEDAYNKMKHEKVPVSPRSSARNQKLMDEQKNLEIKGMTVDQLSKMKVKEVKVKSKDISKAVTTPNNHMKTMTFYERNKTYIEKVMPKDIMDALLCLNTKSIPLYVRDVKIEDTSDELNYKETYTIALEDANRQRSTLKVDFPKIIENRFMYLGGGKKNIKNQSYFYPVVKTEEDTVQMVSNYNKMYIRRIDTKSTSSVERLKRFLKQADGADKMIKFGNSNAVNKSGEFITSVEYDELAKFMKRIHTGGMYLYFSQHDVQDILKKRNLTPPDGYFCVGFDKEDKPIYVAYSGTQKTKAGQSICDLIVDALPEDMRAAYYKIRAPKRLMYVSVKVMNQDITVAMLLGFWEGLTTILRKCKANYRLEAHMPKVVQPSENVIRFKDTFLVYEDTMEAGLLLNGIRMVPTEKWNIGDFDSREPYIEYFVKMYGKAAISNALFNFYEWFIDPVTKEILEDINLPTDLVSLVIYAVSLLADSQFTSDLNQRISRIRSFEIIPMVFYGELASQYVIYRNASGRKKFSLKRDCVIKGILDVATVEEISTLNPTLEIENTHGVSFKGFHGNNLDDMYTIRKRSYDPSMTGTISPISSPDAGCGLNKSLTLEPEIENIRGYVKVPESDKDFNDLKDINLFSAGELTMPGASRNDDPSRAGHAIKQSKHVIPVNDSDPVLVSNGFEEIERFELSSDFVVNAEEDGEIVKVDPDLKLVIAKYKSGKVRAISTDTNIVKNGGGGFYLNNQLVTDLKEGDKFKKDDVLAYHKNFFTNSKYNNCRANLGTLARVAVMSAYSTYEDATFISESLSERCGTRITECKQAVIGKNSNVLHLAKEGEHVHVGDTLVAFDTSYDDNDLNVLLASLGDDNDLKSMVTEGSRNTIKSKYGGKIIAVKMYSTVEMEELSPSLQKIFKDYYSKIRKKKNLLESYDPEAEKSIMKCGLLFTETTKKIEPNKYGNIRGQNVEDSVLIEFYIEELEPLEVASKIANYSGLKNTICEVIPKGYEPYSEFLPDVKYDTIIADNSILKRMTPSILEVGFANKLVVGFKEYLRKIYEK